MARRDFAWTLAAFRLVALAALVVAAAALVAGQTYVVVTVASGPPVVWWDTRYATTWAIVASLALFPLASLLLPRPRREGVRR